MSKREWHARRIRRTLARGAERALMARLARGERSLRLVTLDELDTALFDRERRDLIRSASALADA